MLACSQQQAADQDDPAAGPPVCDGILQDSEGFKIDGTFDADGDGAMDANVPECVAYYGTPNVDCNDNDATINPMAVETTCDGIDNDCQTSTEDTPDNDGDGSTVCDDCDDNDGARAPTRSETCFDSIDNDCDGTVDNDCGQDYNGAFVVDPPINYRCGLVLVQMDVQVLQVVYAPPNLTMYPTTGIQPGSMDGAFSTDTGMPEGSFVVDNLIPIPTPPGCTEHYTIQGEFTDVDHFAGVLSAEYTGFGCLNCNDRQFPFRAVREGQTSTTTPGTTTTTGTTTTGTTTTTTGTTTTTTGTTTTTTTP